MKLIVRYIFGGTVGALVLVLLFTRAGFTTLEVTDNSTISHNTALISNSHSEPEDLAGKWLRERHERIQKFYDPFPNDKYVNVAILMGLIHPGSKMGIREGLYSGGPLGEMIQWADIIAALNSFENKNWDFKCDKR